VSYAYVTTKVGTSKKVVMGIHFSHFQITRFTVFQTHLQNAFFTLFHYSFSKRFSLYHIFTFFAKSILKMRLEKCEK